MKNKQEIGNGPEQDKPKQFGDKIRNFDPVGYLYGISGRKRKTGGTVAILMTVLLMSSVLSNGVSAEVTTKMAYLGAKMTPQDKMNATMQNIYVFVTEMGIAAGGIVIVFAGIKWMMSRGHPDKLAEVKNWIGCIAGGIMLILMSSVLMTAARSMVVT